MPIIAKLLANSGRGRSSSGCLLVVGESHQSGWYVLQQCQRGGLAFCNMLVAAGAQTKVGVWLLSGSAGFIR